MHALTTLDGTKSHILLPDSQIFLLLFVLLYIGSFALIGRFRRRDKEDLCSTDDDEILVYKIR